MEDISLVSIQSDSSHFRSYVKPVPLGVPQGSVIGPVLHVLYINKLVVSQSCAKFTLYADDKSVTFSDRNYSSLKTIFVATYRKPFIWESIIGKKISLILIENKIKWLY